VLASDVQYIILPQLPDCSPVCSTVLGLGFDQLFDVQYMTTQVNRMRRDASLSDTLVLVANRQVLSEAFPNARIEEHQWNSQDLHGSTKTLLWSTLMPSPCLRPYLALMEKRLVLGALSNNQAKQKGNNSSSSSNTDSHRRLCVHNRVEDDFRCWFLRAPGYYSTTEMSNKLVHSLNTQPNLQDIRHIYVAGAYDFDDILETIERITKRNTATKRSLLIGERRGQNTTGIVYNCRDYGVDDARAPKEWSNTFSAIIDWFFCAQSDVFVGNNHSSWSGTVVVWKNGRVHSKLDQAPVVSLQYNDIGPEEVLDLHTFCEPNWSRIFGPWCNYYRRI
jgi:hypothetical protein